jgi:folate-binding Fe-S cluster repair protein YgfZ
VLLQGINTNDITLLQKGSRDVMYSAFLNSQGRFLHDAFLYATSKGLVAA